MHNWGRRTLGLSLLLAVLAGLRAPLPATAVGNENPAITTPTETSAQYSGFTGPFRFDFENAPKGDYAWSVVRTSSQPPVLVDEGTYPNDGVGVPEPVYTAALTAGSYTFTISDVDTGTHQDSVDFTVRTGSPPKCSLVVPTGVRLGAPLVKVTGRLSSTCATLHTASADWKVTRSGRTFDYYRFAGNTTDTWSVYDSDPIGAYAIVPLSARNTDLQAVPQNSPTTVVRRDSRLSLGGSRSGSYVTLRATLKVYSTTTNLFRPWADRYVAVAYRSCRTCDWRALRTLTTDAQGVAGYRFRASTTRDYRVRSAGTTLVWEALPRYARF